MARSEAGLDSSRPQLLLGPRAKDAARVLPAHRARASSGLGEGPVAVPDEGGGAALPALAALQQGPATDKGRRRPRHASTHHAAPAPGIRDSVELRSGRCRRCREAGPQWGSGAAGEPEGRGGLEEAAGPERRRVSPETGLARGCVLGPTPASARWAGQGVWTPPLNPVPTTQGEAAAGEGGAGLTAAPPPLPPLQPPIPHSQDPKFIFRERDSGPVADFPPLLSRMLPAAR